MKLLLLHQLSQGNQLNCLVLYRDHHLQVEHLNIQLHVIDNKRITEKKHIKDVSITTS